MARINVSVGFENLSEVLGDLARYSETAQRKTKQQVARSTFNVQRYAKTDVPVDTGRLKTSIQTQFSTDRTQGIIGTNVEYSKDVEYGTTRQRPQPYLNPSLERERPNFIRKLNEILAGD